METTKSEKKEIQTEVTSIAQEELRTGVKVNIPSHEVLVDNAMKSFYSGRKKFNEMFSQLSARGKTRVMNSVLDLPTEGLPVYLKDEKEKIAFFVGQRVISDKFIIIQNEITKEIRKDRAAKAETSKQVLTEEVK